MVDIFNLTKNENFYSLLTSPNKHIYWEVICSFYDIISNNAERRISKVTAKMTIEEIIDKHITIEDNNTSPVDANNILKRLSETSWISIQYDGMKNCDYISFLPYAYNFIAFNYHYERDNRDIKTGEFLTLILNIVNQMKDKEDTNSQVYKFPYREGLLRIEKNTLALVNELFHITERIENDINLILSSDNLQSLIEKLTNYINEVNNGYIASIYEKSNITPFQKSTMLSLMQDIRSDSEFQERIIADMKAYYAGEMLDKSREELFVELDRILSNIENNFCHKYQDYRKKIDYAKSDIIEKAISKKQILSTSSTSLVSVINKIIDFISNASQEETTDIAVILSNLFRLHKNFLVKNGILYSRNVSEKAEIVEEVKSIDPNSPEFDTVFSNDAYITSKVNQYANEFLEDKDEVYVKDIEATKENINKIILIGLYADCVDTCYGIEIVKEKIQKGNCLMDNFIIRRKQNGTDF